MYQSDAEMLGIDLDKLEQERFGSLSHYQLMKVHADRVRAYDISKRYEQLASRLVQLAEEDRVAVLTRVQGKNRKRRERKTGRLPDSDYSFTPEQLEIAIRSLSRHADQKS